MDHEQFGNADAYYTALSEIRTEGIPQKHLAMLQAHFDSQNHTTTWAQLAESVGYSNGKAVNLQYGKLAKRVAHSLGINEAPQGFWLYVLAGWGDELDAMSGHTTFVLRRPVIAALTMLGIFPNEIFELLPDEFAASTLIHEGGRRQVLVNAYERNPKARRQSIEAHGNACCICGFHFGTVYGPDAEGYIHVHHVRPLSEADGEHVVNPVEDLWPVCPNCHAVLHLGNYCRSIQEVRQLLNSHRHASV